MIAPGVIVILEVTVQSWLLGLLNLSLMSDEVELELCKSAVPENTKSVTEWGIMTPTDLSYWMRKLVLEVRKKDGSMYPPKTLYALVCCFKRYYEANGVHNINPLDPSDAKFGSFRAVLDAEMKRLHSLGLGSTTKQAQPITPDEEALLWSTGQFGRHSSVSLLNTVYYYNCKVFGLRSYDEHKNLMCAQYEKKVDERGRIYLQYTDFESTTNHGGLKHNKVIRQYENPDDEEHYIVNIYLTCDSNHGCTFLLSSYL